MPGDCRRFRSNITSSRFLNPLATVLHYSGMSTVKTKMETDVEALIRKHQAQVWQYLRYLGANPAEADDLTQETFLALMRSSYEDRGEAAFLGFLRKIARNQLLMFRRKCGTELDTVQLEVAEHVWSRAIKSDGVDSFLSELERCREKLEGRAKQAIDFSYHEGLSRNDIAARLDMKPQGVKTLLRRTRAVLRECVERGIEQ